MTTSSTEAFKRALTNLNSFAAKMVGLGYPIPPNVNQNDPEVQTLLQRCKEKWGAPRKKIE